MNSEYKQLKLTAEQEKANEDFLNNLREEFVLPLVGEFEEQIKGFSEMDDIQRLAHVLKLNEPLQGKGDSLSLGDSSNLVYAGERLGNLHEYVLGGITFEQYRPRFAGKYDGFRTFVENFVIIGETEYFLTFERDKYNTLPPSYKAALLCRYINMRVITADTMALVAFVLGSPESLHTDRYSVSLITSEGSFLGWDIRIADNMPDAAFWGKLREVICNGGRIPAKNAKQKRKPDPKTDFVCRYIYSLEQNGINIDARSGGLGYKKIMADLELQHPNEVRHYEPDTLGRVYRDWKKRNVQEGEGR